MLKYFLHFKSYNFDVLHFFYIFLLIFIKYNYVGYKYDVSVSREWYFS